METGDRRAVEKLPCPRCKRNIALHVGFCPYCDAFISSVDMSQRVFLKQDATDLKILLILVSVIIAFLDFVIIYLFPTISIYLCAIICVLSYLPVVCAACNWFCPWQKGNAGWYEKGYSFDIQDIWPALTDAEKLKLVSRGLVHLNDCNVEVVSCEQWRSLWTGEELELYPTYTLRISCGSSISLDVTGYIKYSLSFPNGRLSEMIWTRDTTEGKPKVQGFAIQQESHSDKPTVIPFPLWRKGSAVWKTLDSISLEVLLDSKVRNLPYDPNPTPEELEKLQAVLAKANLKTYCINTI